MNRKLLFIVSVFLVALLAASCAHRKHRCKQDAKRIKKQGIGWKY